MMHAVDPIRAPRLNEIGRVQHGFFGRRGGVSQGLYASLNCGFGSDDAPAHVAENRNRAMTALDSDADQLVTLYQTHSANVAVIDAARLSRESITADAAVTRDPQTTLGILTADCAPVLLADAEAKVIGAAHAGWRGALGGIVENTIAAMARLGADTDRIVAAVGPCIGPRSYEVGEDLRLKFDSGAGENEAFFAPGPRPGHWLFDLPGYVVARCRAAGVKTIDVTGHDTLAEDGDFFSYRRNFLAGESDYGRNLAAIKMAS